MESFNIAFCLNDGLFQFNGYQRGSTFEFGFGNEEFIGAGSIDFLCNSVEGFVAVSLYTLEDSADTCLDNAVVKLGSLAERRPSSGGRIYKDGNHFTLLLYLTEERECLLRRGP